MGSYTINIRINSTARKLLLNYLSLENYIEDAYLVNHQVFSRFADPNKIYVGHKVGGEEGNISLRIGPTLKKSVDVRHLLKPFTEQALINSTINKETTNEIRPNKTKDQC